MQICLNFLEISELKFSYLIFLTECNESVMIYLTKFRFLNVEMFSDGCILINRICLLSLRWRSKPVLPVIPIQCTEERLCTVEHSDFFSWQCVRYFGIGKRFLRILEKVFFFILSGFLLNWIGSKNLKMALLRGEIFSWSRSYSVQKSPIKEDTVQKIARCLI
jgi:hypothetical protein